MRRLVLWVPLGVFAALLAIVVAGLLRPDDRLVRSAMIGRPLPQFLLPGIATGHSGLASADFARGTPRLLNVFGSWCIPCAAEAPQLLQLKAMGVAIDGLAIHDTGDQVDRFLAANGDPYARIGNDAGARVQLALGSSGVPESFVIDGRGRIVLQKVGDIRPEDVPAIAAAVRDAR